MNTDYQKHALITGATSGIGYELAKLFAKDNYNLVLVARDAVNLRETKQEITDEYPGIHIHTIDADLFENDASRKIYEMTEAKGIRVDVLVNNAGQGEWGKFTDTDSRRDIDIINLNIVATTLLTKLYLRDMVKRNSGKILQLASSVSKTPAPYLSVYAATKAYVLSLTEALQKEVEGTNVTITALQPGATDTDFFHKAKAEHTVTYQETDLYSPETVARAGYDGLMNGEATVKPGLMNKAQSILTTLLPDNAVSANMEKQMLPSEKNDQSKMPKHPASARERQRINDLMSATNGDLG